MVSFIFPGPDRCLGRLPVVLGQEGGFRYVSGWEPLSRTRIDVRQAAVLTTPGAIGAIDQLVAASNEGLFEYCPGTRDWILERRGVFTRLLVYRADESTGPVILAAGQDELVCFDGVRTQRVLSWSEPLRPVYLGLDRRRLIMAFERLREPGVIYLAGLKS